MGFLGGGGAAGGGAGILGHIFGGHQASVERAVSRSSGVDVGSVSQIMAMIAPLLMGSVGRASREQGLDARGLAAALGEQERAARSTSSSADDLFGRLLDGDDDGDSMDDIVRMGSGLLGGLFGSRR